MKIVLLSDLHGNMTAAEAMERELDRLRPDDVWFLGDAVGKGPENHRTCDWVRSRCTHWVAGNWDRGLSADREKHPFYAAQLGPARFAWLDSLPLEDELTIAGLRFRLLHGRFLDPMYQSGDPDEVLRQGFRFHDGRPDADGFICADSHRPFVRPIGSGYAINTGSVGNNLGGNPRAHAVLLEGEPAGGPLAITILSVPYDNRAAAEAADRYPDLPDREAWKREVLTGIYSHQPSRFSD